MIIRILKTTLTVLTFLSVLFVLLFVFLIYPDDRRVTPREIDTLKEISTHRKHQISLFQTPIDFSYDAPLELYKKNLENISTAYPNHLGRDSSRFQSPYQTYLAVGSYPYFLEGKDSVLLASGKKITLEPKLSGHFEMDFSLVSLFSKAKITLLRNNSVIKRFEIGSAGKVEKADSFIYKNFTRYAFPDRDVAGGRWAEQSLEVELGEGDTLSLVCETEQEGCFLSEVSFWKNMDQKPSVKNVIFVLVDTLRYDALESEHAPFLRSLKEKSLSFDNAMGAGNMTSISTNALLSCQKPSKIGSLAFSYGLSSAEQNAFYKRDQASFPTLLQKEGIKTAMIGNISIISEILGIGVDHGFDDQISIEMEGYDSAHITNASIDWLKKNGSDPFFLYVHYNSTHAPYRAPLHDIFSTLKGLESFKSQRNFLLSLYQAEVRYVNRNLQLLQDAIRKLGLEKNTIFVLSSDHGDAHELRSYFENEAGPPYVGSNFDHVGTLLYNDVLHVPLLISLPSQEKGEKVSDVVSGLDIGPTILEMFGLAKPSWCDGLSLFSRAELKERSVIGSEGEAQRAIFLNNRYKYMKSYASSEKRMAPEKGYFTEKTSIFIGEQLFDLQKDPLERVNLAHTDKQVLKEAREAFDRYFEIREFIELVVDAPQGEEIEVSLPTSEKYSLLEPNSVMERGSTLSIESIGTKRLLVPFRKFPSVLPTVKIGGKTVPLLFSSLRIPLRSGIAFLPGEEVEFDHISSSKSPSAFVVKTRGDQAMQRKLQFGNARFENIFKEWGYLNEEN